jgi:hypothetical protein
MKKKLRKVLTLVFSQLFLTTSVVQFFQLALLSGRLGFGLGRAVVLGAKFSFRVRKN